MACIAAVVLVDGFQHLEEEFFTKALAFGSVWHQTFNLCQFDSTGLLLQISELAPFGQKDTSNMPFFCPRGYLGSPASADPC